MRTIPIEIMGEARPITFNFTFSIDQKGGTPMNDLKSAYRGCLLGLAVGDALGEPADKLTWDQIREDFGPLGLMGYAGDNPRITSHTQLCAFTANGLLLGQTRGQISGKMAPFARYMALAQKEWAKAQRPHSRQPERTYCWVYWLEQLRRRACADSRMTDMLASERLGTPEEPINRLDGSGSLTAAVAAGLFGVDPAPMGADAVALTYGHSTAILSGAIVADLIHRVVHRRDETLEELLRRSLAAVEEQFSPRFPKARTVTAAVAYAMDLALQRKGSLEMLVCQTAPQVLAGAAYTLMACDHDFDAAMVMAVNHSGRSSAVAALAGAILGAYLGDEALPAFYVEGLDVVKPLKTLADDLRRGCPTPMDLEWDRKYIQGEP